MDSIFFANWGAWGLAALALFIGTLSGWVAQEAAKRILVSLGPERLGWQLVLTLALGTGLWSSHVILAWSARLPFEVAYGVAYTLGGGAVALCVSALVAWVIDRQYLSVLRVAGVATVLALGIVVASVINILALGLHPGVSWDVMILGLALVSSFLGTSASLGLIYTNGERQAPDWKRQAMASVVWGFTALAAQRLVLFAVDWQHQSGVDNAHPLSAQMLAALASVGAVILLVTLWLGLLLEARLRTSLRIANVELQRNSHTDLLTGLPNRLAFELNLAEAAQRTDLNNSQLALLFIDLDGFKPINEIYGHHGGDRLLCEMANRLRSLADPEDHLARLGVDEFLMLITDNASANAASERARRILECLAQPYKLEGGEACMTCSVGVAMYPQSGAMSTLIARADAAKRSAKIAGGAAFAFFEVHMLSQSREQVELLQELRGAVARGEFELFYQPKIYAPTGEITGAEALLRWRHPQRGMVSPVVFIPLAERFGLINSIGAWVIEEACRQIEVWRKEGLRMRIAVNISVHQLRQADLPDRIAEALKRHQVTPALFTCEITESVAMDEATVTQKLFERLAAVGVHISIDDFGTGYSSLSYLRKLPAGELKIDRSFVMDLETSSDARAVVDAVIKLAQALSLKVVAEGVETAMQNQILCSLGCDELQGYYFAKPMTAQALALWAIRSEGPTKIDFRQSLFDPI